jgi:ribonuclease R
MLTLHIEQFIQMARHKKKKSGRILDKESMKNHILGVFAKNPSLTYNYKQLAKQLLVRKSEERKQILSSLSILKDEDYIEEIYPGKFKMKSKDGNVIGKIEITTGGYGFVISDTMDEDIFISQKNFYCI